MEHELLGRELILLSSLAYRLRNGFRLVVLQHHAMTHRIPTHDLVGAAHVRHDRNGSLCSSLEK